MLAQAGIRAYPDGSTALFKKCAGGRFLLKEPGCDNVNKESWPGAPVDASKLL
jgi:hypothetical protein